MLQPVAPVRSYKEIGTLYVDYRVTALLSGQPSFDDIMKYTRHDMGVMMFHKMQEYQTENGDDIMFGAFEWEQGPIDSLTMPLTLKVKVYKQTVLGV